MIVVGGIYDEVCYDPSVQWTLGSGVRAAAVLGAAAEVLVSAADEQSKVSAQAVLGEKELRLRARSAPITFEYDTPVTSPRAFGAPRHDIEFDDVEGSAVLMYGMVEGMPHVRGDVVVADPQHSASLSELTAHVEARTLLVVANRQEVALLGGSSDVLTAAKAVRDSTGASTVVVKCGALGALVVTAEETSAVGAVPVATVFPIGSGDVFTAAFARAVVDGLAPVEAAVAASKRTAMYCATRQFGDVTLHAEVGSVGVGDIVDPPSVYLAASFASPEQRWLARTAARGLEDVGVRVFDPLRDVGPVNDTRQTAAADLRGLAASHSVLLLGDSARSGPFFEGGWAARYGLPIVVVSSDEDAARFTMLRGAGALVVHDLATGVYHAAWSALRHRQEL